MNLDLDHLSLPFPLRAFLENRAATVGTAFRLDANVDLLRQGDRPEHVHLLLDGWACRTFYFEDGRRQIPALLLPGDLVDLDRLVSDRAEFGVCALTPCRFACLPVAALRSVVERDHELANTVLWLALKEVAILNRRNVALARQTAYERLAALLCELVTRLTESGAPRKETYTLPLTQSVLGDVVGLSTVHVNRVLQSLRKDGLIRSKGRQLEILDWPGLVAAGTIRDGMAGCLEAGRGSAAAGHAPRCRQPAR